MSGARCRTDWCRILLLFLLAALPVEVLGAELWFRPGHRRRAGDLASL